MRYPQTYRGVDLSGLARLSDEHGVHEPIMRDGELSFEGGAGHDARRMRVTRDGVALSTDDMASVQRAITRGWYERMGNIRITADDLSDFGKATQLGADAQADASAQADVDTRRPKRLEGPPRMEPHPAVGVPYRQSPMQLPEHRFEWDSPEEPLNIPPWTPDDPRSAQDPWWDEDDSIPIPDLDDEGDTGAYDPEVERAKSFEEGQEDKLTMIPDIGGSARKEEWAELLKRAWTPAQQRRLDQLKAKRLAQEYRDLPEEGWHQSNISRGAPPDAARELLVQTDGSLALYDENEPEAKLRKLRPDGGMANIMTLMDAATDDEIRHYKDWYSYATRDAEELAGAYDVPVPVVVGIIAAMSPNVEWDQNIRAAQQILRGKGENVLNYKRKLGRAAAGNVMAALFPDMFVRPVSLGTFGYTASIDKAQRVLDAWDEFGRFDLDPQDEKVRVSWDPTDLKDVERAADEFEWAQQRNYTIRYGSKARPKGVMDSFDPTAGGFVMESPVSGPKVTPFYRSLLDAPSAAKRGDVVLDGHAINIWRGAPQPLDSAYAGSSDALKDRMREDYRRAAKKWNKSERAKQLGLELSPQAVQGITWSVWRKPAAKRLKLDSKKRGAKSSGIGERALRTILEKPVTFAVFSAGKTGTRDKGTMTHTVDRGEREKRDTNERRHTAILRELHARGYSTKQIKFIRGKWWQGADVHPERSIMVMDMPFSDARELSDKLGQDAFIWKSADGVAGMYDFTDMTVRVPSQGGAPLFGEDALLAAAQKKKPGPDEGGEELRTTLKRPLHSPDDEPEYTQTWSSGLPSDQDMVSRTRGTTWQFSYEWEDPTYKLPWDGNNSYDREDVLLRTTAPTANQVGDDRPGGSQDNAGGNLQRPPAADSGSDSGMPHDAAQAREQAPGGPVVRVRSADLRGVVSVGRQDLVRGRRV